MKYIILKATSPENAFLAVWEEIEKFQMIYITDETISDNSLDNILTNNPTSCIVILKDEMNSSNKLLRPYSFERIIHEGPKNWITKYMILKGNPKGCDHITFENINRWDTKKEAEDIAKKYTSLYKVNTHVIIGKSPINFNRLQTTITYKTDQQQHNVYQIYYKI